MRLCHTHAHSTAELSIPNAPNASFHIAESGLLLVGLRSGGLLVMSCTMNGDCVQLATLKAYALGSEPVRLVPCSSRIGCIAASDQCPWRVQVREGECTFDNILVEDVCAGCLAAQTRAREH